ncbi:hypothetical protein HGA34_01975 [Candidatus Falkowbacteria bacterium]|nr:hypothetical protein [Candidatus Falkowbacteria bacterium]
MLEDSKEVNNPELEPIEPAQAVRPSINRNQKLFLAILVLIGFSMIGLWAAQLRQGIAQPFQPKNSQNSPENSNVTNNNTTEQTDTDNDGLWDVDELNTYGTSPYLDDTDGDNISDGNEIKSGGNPNCPEGKNCEAPTAPASDVASSTALIMDQNATTSPAAAPKQTQPGTISSGLSDEEMKSMLEGNMSAAALRQALLKSGADPKLLEQLSDDDLLKSYKQSLTSQ